jgi:hypothetical protein
LGSNPGSDHLLASCLGHMIVPWNSIFSFTSSTGGISEIWMCKWIWCSPGTCIRTINLSSSGPLLPWMSHFIGHLLQRGPKHSCSSLKQPSWLRDRNWVSISYNYPHHYLLAYLTIRTRSSHSAFHHVSSESSLIVQHLSQPSGLAATPVTLWLLLLPDPKLPRRVCRGCSGEGRAGVPIRYQGSGENQREC